MALFSANESCGRARTGTRRLLRRYLRDRRGNIAAITALLIVPLVGIMGVATETSSWFLIQRSAQNAADSAVLAAATNRNNATYQLEAKSVTTKFGFTNGANNTVVTPVNGQACPAPLGGNACYKVTVSRDVPIYLTRIVGYSGTVALGSGRGQTVVASAMARLMDNPVSDCITSLGTGIDSYRVNGNGNGNANIVLNGCNVQANGDAKCAGINANAGVSYFFVAGGNNGCSPLAPNYPSPQAYDPYLTRNPRTNIPGNGNSCGSNRNSYPQITHNGPALPSSNLLTGTVNVAKTFCGDVQLTGNVTAATGGVMVIENGSLDLAGHTFTGTGLTIIFTGSTVAGLTPTHMPPSDGTLDISAPTSGTWSGVALYQDPALTSGVDWSSSGNALNWNITGLIYMPKSNISFSGTINKATSGVDCFAIVDWKIQLSGSVGLTEGQTQCAAAGLSPPTSSLQRAFLVQ